MTLRLIREPSIGGATLGALYLDGVWQCWTLEDQIRETHDARGDLRPPAQWKVPAQTAIPPGIYVVRLTMSARFQRVLPLIEAVPGFEGIRIHAGNGSGDTEGCLLVGQVRGAAKIGASVAALVALLPMLSEPLQLRVENPVR